jgi:hypothetical protein
MPDGGSVDDSGRQHRHPQLMTSLQTQPDAIHLAVVDADATREPANVYPAVGLANRDNEASSGQAEFRASFELAALPEVGPLYRHALRRARRRSDTLGGVEVPCVMRTIA